ncbi:hypothetical protein ACOBWA_08395 [Psychrobacter sp. ER1]|uniref:hypothetical protein n=1 Tax=Psychrobacter sp. ER1 TaxID=3406645 RepID=UPI003B43B43E
MVLTDVAKNAMLQGLANKLNAGTNSLLSVYIGATLAVEITLTNPVELSITGGMLRFNVPPQALAIASGIPTEARILDASGALMVTLPASLITLDKEKVYQGGYVGVTSIRFSI